MYQIHCVMRSSCVYMLSNLGYSTKVKASSEALRDILIKHEDSEEFVLRLMTTLAAIFSNLKEQPRCVCEKYNNTMYRSSVLHTCYNEISLFLV